MLTISTCHEPSKHDSCNSVYTIRLHCGEPLRTWGEGQWVLYKAHPPLGMAQEQKGSERENSHHPNLSDLLLKAHQGTLVAPSLGISLLLKGGGTDPLRN